VNNDQETILLVDDNPTNLEVLYKTLEHEGYRLLVAKDGAAALDIIRSVHPSLVLLDVMMPDMDGFEVCEIVKADPDTADVAVVFLSALGDVESKVKGFQVGGVDYVSKPFQADEVVMRVATHVKVKRLERELSRKNLLLESEIDRILNSMSEGIYGLALDGAVNYANPAALGFCGWQEREILAKNIFETHFGKSADQKGINQLALANGRVVELDNIDLKRKDGSLFPASACLTPNVVNDEVVGGVLVFRDITERIKAQEALNAAQVELRNQSQHLAHIERLSTMGEMAAGFAHEVNQPLTAIANYASVSRRLLEKGIPEPEKLADTLGKMQAQAIRASEVVERLRQFVRAPKGVRFVRSPNQLISEVLSLAEVDSLNNGVPIIFNPKDNVADVYVDEVQIQQVALNLLRNAMEAMKDVANKEQGVSVVVEPAGSFVKVSFIDHGVGLEEGAEEKLFHPFYTTKSNGTGIGLSVCASIIQQHGGRIGFKRHADIGTTFYFELPLTVEAD
jgi:two-component system sensor kinase FixL